MQRLFSAFPGGIPGIGLLLLRVVVGSVAVAQGALHLAGADGTAGAWIVDTLAIVSGTLLLVGFLTPGTGVSVIVAVALCRLPALSQFRILDGTATLLVAADAAAIALLGPGAFSVDALLFGRREILIPHEAHTRR